MPAIFAFRCSCCRQVHEGSPSIAFVAPDQYACLTDEQKSAMGRLSSDFCTIEYDGHTDYFIRAVLEIPIHGVEEPFLWGVWVSASEASFKRYLETYDVPVPCDDFSGWLCNTPRPYPWPSSRLADVRMQANGKRPKVMLHRGVPERDALVLDQLNGISIARAQQLAEQAIHKA
jgi:hypothetical protein